MSGGERFTEEERALLSRYVTDIDGRAFVLTNLPEVIKGALFSRYSRSPKGLRRLLLDEFIRAEEAAFDEIGGSAAPDTGRSALAVQRAQDFYDRILDGYGDDSIGELGGAHLALEDVSMLATKVIEDARIGGSPLEKSTRYVSFAGQRDGEFLFYREPTLMASRHAERYVDTCRHLFETYRDLLGPMTEHLRRVVPREEGASEAAYSRSVRARAFDALRGLLPAATLTNMGVFGNGRFFEALLARMEMHGLAELRDLAGEARGELGKVIPSFIRRGDPAHPHFAAQQRAHDAQRDLLRRAASGVGARQAGAAQGNDVPPPPDSFGRVDLVDWDASAEDKVLAALLYPHGDAPLEPLLAAVRNWAPERRRAVLEELAAARGNRRHKLPRGLETAGYTFDLLGDFGMYRDLHRHRMLTQERQPLSARHGYVVPAEVADAGLEPPYAEAMRRAADAWEAIAADHPAEAQYVVPMAYRIRWLMHVNLRALCWLVELRSQPAGHPAYRWMAQELYRRVDEVHPRLAALMRFVDLQDYALGRLDAEQRHESRQAAGEGR